MRGAIAVNLSKDIAIFEKDWEKAREQVYLMIVNYEANQDMLKKVPHVPFLDLAFMVYVKNGEGCASSCIVRHKECEEWGISEQELFHIAKENTMKDACVNHIEEVIEILCMENGYSEVVGDEDTFCDIPMYVVSNEANCYGAAMIDNQRLLLDIAQHFESDLFILPSSIHELIVLPVFMGKDIGDLRSIVQEINREKVLPKEFLSDEVYYFSRDTQEVSSVR